MCAMPATLIVSEFLRCYEVAGRPRLPMLERMLARATQGEPRHTYDCLATLFGLQPAVVQPGPFMRLADGGKPDDGYWLRADPVHLAPDRDQLVLMPSSVLEVQHAELHALAKAFDAIYAAEGWHLDFPSVERGYLRAPRALDALTHDPVPFIGGPVLAAMPSGPDGKLLKQLMNETQMLFHTHAVNTVREEANRPTINSLWCWGGGQLPPKTVVSPNRIFGDLPLIVGMAHWADKEIRSPNRNYNWEEGDLIVLGRNDPRTLDRDWFGPLLSSLQEGDIRTLDLHLEGFGGFQLDTAASQRFWRRSKPIQRS
jgi:hypothetical protein